MAERRAEAELRRATALLQQGQEQAAEQLYRRLLARGVETPTLLGNLAVICWRQGRLTEMETLLRRSLARDPEQGDALYNLGLVLAQRGAHQEAVAHYRRALPLAAADLQGSIHWNLSKLLLRCGHYAEGWEHYEWRRHKRQPLPPICPPGMPAWQEGPVADGELVLVGEQGLGDMIQFLRYAPAMAGLAPRIALALPEKLHGLVRAAALPVQLLTPAELSAQRHGQWLPLLSCPRLLGVSASNVVVPAPYLQIPEERRRHWRQRLRAGLEPGQRLIAIHWQGNPATETNELQGRSLPLEQLAPLAQLEGVRLVSLQKGAGHEQLAESALASRLVACQAEVDACWEFVDTGAMLLACDLLISSDSALVHLAGAIGAPCWLLLHHSSDWRWGADGDTSFWYPSLRLFRQRQPGDWAGLMAAVLASLQPGPGPDPRPGQAMQHLQQGDLDGAAALYRALIRDGSADALAYGNLGAIELRQGHNAAAIALLHRALDLDPALAAARNNLGTAFRRQGDRENAVAHYRQAVLAQPDSAEFQRNLGLTLHELGAAQEAAQAFREANRLEPTSANTANLLAIALKESGDTAGAIRWLERAVELEPQFAEAHNNLGNTWLKLGELPQAIAAYSRAIALRPTYHDARKGRGMALLLQGEYAAGWRDYESRLQSSSQPTLLNANPPCRRWSGSTLPAGSRLLLVSEQGLGDTIQFMRYLPLLRQRGMAAQLCAPEKLHGLIAASGIDAAPLTPAQADGVSEGFWLPLLSLPAHLGVSASEPICSSPYLHASEARIQHWAALLSQEPRPLIAIHWQGNPVQEQANASGRSLPLEAFAPIAASGIGTLLSLQKGPGSEQRESCSFRDRFAACQEAIDHTWDFLETAAIVANCDLVITSDTALAHLAGGLGHPTWLLLQKIPEWRWGLAGDSTPWYPSMRLFRQQQPGDWAGVISAVLASLRRSWPTAQPSAEQRQQQALQLLQQQRTAEAEAIYRQLLAEGVANAAVESGLGVLCAGSARLDEAVRLLSAALQRQPHSLSALVNLAEVHCQRDEWDQAEPLWQRVLEQQPRHRQALNRLRTTYNRSGRHAEAMAMTQRALACSDDPATELCQQGNELMVWGGDVAVARSCYEQALIHRPEAVEAQGHLAMVLLLQGDYRRGLELYEQRHHMGEASLMPIAPWPHPRWNPASAAAGEAPLLVIGEQGLGDMLQFSRYVPELQQHGREVWLCLPEKLVELARISGLASTVLSAAELRTRAEEAPRQWAPLLSLPWHLGVSPEQPLVQEPYLQTAPLRRWHWQQRLQAAALNPASGQRRAVIGLHWQGAQRSGHLHGRSFPLQVLTPLTQLEELAFLSLQKGDGSDQLPGSAFAARLLPCQAEVEAGFDFVETAAIVQACDLVITCDTAMAHLAGGLGAPTWLLLPHTPDWRWGLEGSTSFWYPSLRLFRQPRPGDWHGVVQELQAALEAWLHQRRRAA